jgi:hypothetical protein
LSLLCEFVVVCSGIFLAGKARPSRSAPWMVRPPW